MTDKTKRKIGETLHYKLIRTSYLDFGYMARCRYITYNILDKVTGRYVGMFSDLKSARKELQYLENKSTLEVKTNG